VSNLVQFKRLLGTVRYQQHSLLIRSSRHQSSCFFGYNITSYVKANPSTTISNHC